MTRVEKSLPWLFLTVLVLDQVTKNIALATLEFGKSVPVMGNLVRWTLVFNPAGAFSLRFGNPTYYLLLSLVIFIILIIYIIRHRRTAYLAIPLSIVAGGAAGNIIDRFRFGQVVDFIDCDFIDFTIGSYSMDRWPIFNIADMAVSCGIITTVLLVLYYSRKNQTASDDDNSSDNRPVPENLTE